MPITENSFTAAEIQAAVTANPALVTELKTGLTPLGHHAIPKDEYEKFVETERGRIAGEERSTIYGTLDKDVFETSGVAKASGDEKTYDYIKRVIGSNKQAIADATKERDALKEQMAKGNTDPVMKQQLETLNQELADLKTNTLPKYEKDLFAKDVRFEFANGLRALKLKSDIPKILLEPALDKAQADLLASAKKDAQGNIYFADANGAPILNGTEVATAEFILKTKLADILDNGVQQTGTGTKPPDNGGAGAGASSGIKNADGKDIVIPETIKTKMQLTEFLGKEGLIESSKEYIELFKKYGEKLPLRA